MSFIGKLKRNRFIQGVYMLYRRYFICSRKRFGYIADDVTLIPPIFISNPENVYLYGNNGLNNASILTTKAKFIMKPHSGSAEGLKVSTGNHAMILGRFYRTITEAEKPKQKRKNKKQKRKKYPSAGKRQRGWNRNICLENHHTSSLYSGARYIPSPSLVP